METEQLKTAARLYAGILNKDAYNAFIARTKCVERWMPKFWDEFYSINRYGQVERFRNEGILSMGNLISISKYYATDKIAEKHRCKVVEAYK